MLALRLPAQFQRSCACYACHAVQIMNLALLVVSYGVSHRLFEFAWKGQLRALFPTPALYQVWQAAHELFAC